MPLTVSVDCSIFVSEGSFATLGKAQIACGNPPPGRAGTRYAHAFPVRGGSPPYVFSVRIGSLPPGLTLDAATGRVSGTPTTPGVYAFTIGLQAT